MPPLSASLRIFISEAGVAASPLMATIGADWDPGCVALRYGDLLEELDLGVAGGGIKMSDRGSGDIDPASELSLL